MAARARSFPSCCTWPRHRGELRVARVLDLLVWANGGRTRGVGEGPQMQLCIKGFWDSGRDVMTYIVKEKSVDLPNSLLSWWFSGRPVQGAKEKKKTNKKKKREECD